MNQSSVVLQTEGEKTTQITGWDCKIETDVRQASSTVGNLDKLW